MRLLLFAALAAGSVAYAYWIYTRVELRVAAGPGLAVVRSVVLVVVLLLLFNPRLPVGDGAGAPTRWVLLDASLSMVAEEAGGEPAWDRALARAEELAAEGWSVIRFGGSELERGIDLDLPPDQLESRLAPALASAAESGAREVRVLTDARIDDAVAVRSALEVLPLAASFESFGDSVAHAGIARFQVPDVSRPDASPTAEIDVFGEGAGDSIRFEILEEGRPVAAGMVEAPSPGLRATTTVELPPPSESGTVRYTARILARGAGPSTGQEGEPTAGDGFPDDDVAVAYANVGFESGGVVVLSLRPDWEPRYLLPVLEDVTGLRGAGYLRAGADRFLPMGPAVERGAPVNVAIVQRAAREATILVVHGASGDADEWIGEVVGGPGRRLVLPIDPAGAALAGLEVRGPREGEWYVSPDVPSSPIAGALSGVFLDGLPPLTDVLEPQTPIGDPPLQLQLRGAGAPQSALALRPRPEGRAVVALASGFWRWAMREGGRETYRRLWSGVAGWLLTDGTMASPEPRPVRWVFARSEPVEWSMPLDTGAVRIRVESDDSAVVDTVVAGGQPATLGVLPPGAYRYAALSTDTDTLGSGRFDVAATTLEMLPRAEVPSPGAPAAEDAGPVAPTGPPLRTTPWPYLLVITLLCGEWILRRRSGLR